MHKKLSAPRLGGQVPGEMMNATRSSGIPFFDRKNLYGHATISPAMGTGSRRCTFQQHPLANENGDNRDEDCDDGKL